MIGSTEDDLTSLDLLRRARDGLLIETGFDKLRAAAWPELPEGDRRLDDFRWIYFVAAAYVFDSLVKLFEADRNSALVQQILAEFAAFQEELEIGIAREERRVRLH